MVHIHANNFADLSPSGFPGAVEITFLNKTLLQQEPVISAQRYPLPGLDQHLLALERRNTYAAEAAMHHVQESFGQRGAVEKVLKRRT